MSGSRAATAALPCGPAVRVERARATVAVTLAIDPAQLPPPDPDGLCRIDIDALALLALADQIQSAQRGLVLMMLYPPGRITRDPTSDP